MTKERGKTGGVFRDGGATGAHMYGEDREGNECWVSCLYRCMSSFFLYTSWIRHECICDYRTAAATNGGCIVFLESVRAMRGP